MRIVFPETIALENFHWEDFVFKLRPDLPVEKRIVLVNIGKAGRSEAAEMIEIINEQKPKVIGVLVFYNCEFGLRDSVNCPQLIDTAGNRSLSEAIRKTKRTTGLPAGSRNYGGTFSGLGTSANWWTSEGFDTGDAWYRVVGYNGYQLFRIHYAKNIGFSVRCIKD